VRERSQAELPEGSQPAVQPGAQAELHQGAKAELPAGVKACVLYSLHTEVHTGTGPKVPPCANNRVSETAEAGKMPPDSPEILRSSGCQGSCDCSSSSLWPGQRV